MKHEWRKHEKHLYLPKRKPALITIPTMNYFVIEGQGNPNKDAFLKRVEALYTVSYAIRMSHKKGTQPEGYFEYTVYPLEGVWSLTEEAIKERPTSFSKDDFRYQIMIRQPGFVTNDYANALLSQSSLIDKNPLVSDIRFVSIEDGDCIQMSHLGPYDNEPETFALMEAYAESIGRTRTSKIHKEIYISDPRKTALEKLKTTLRFQLKS